MKMVEPLVSLPPFSMDANNQTAEGDNSNESV